MAVIHAVGSYLSGIVEIKNSEVVKEIFALAKTYTHLEIIQYLNAKYSLKFSFDRLNRLLANQLYIGELMYKGKIYNDIVPAIVDEQTFEK